MSFIIFIAIHWNQRRKKKSNFFFCFGVCCCQIYKKVMKRKGGERGRKKKLKKEEDSPSSNKILLFYGLYLSRSFNLSSSVTSYRQLTANRIDLNFKVTFLWQFLFFFSWSFEFFFILGSVAFDVSQYDASWNGWKKTTKQNSNTHSEIDSEIQCGDLGWVFFLSVFFFEVGDRVHWNVDYIFAGLFFHHLINLLLLFCAFSLFRPLSFSVFLLFSRSPVLFLSTLMNNLENVCKVYNFVIPAMALIAPHYTCI